jgi:Tol biopolymer transport system component
MVTSSLLRLQGHPMKRIAFAALFAGIFGVTAACAEKSPAGPDDSSHNSPAGPDDSTHNSPAAPDDSTDALYQIVTREQLVLMNSDGTGAVALGTGFSPGFYGKYSPSWSPDGTRLIFSTNRCGFDYNGDYTCQFAGSDRTAADSGGLVIMNPETKEITRPAAGALGEEPAWSPTEDMVAFTRFTDKCCKLHLFVMRLDGSEAQELSTPDVIDNFEPSWSPDGQQIAFNCLKPTFGICVINKDGTNFRRLTDDALWDGHEWGPQWSPDGTRIAFYKRTQANPTLGVAVMAADGTGLTRLTDGSSPRWSADGTKLIFLNDGVFTMNADGSSITPSNRKYGIRRPQPH